MAYFPDLSPYSYGHHSQPGVVHVGWLDSTHPFTRGDVDPATIKKLRVLASRPVELYRGFHLCELCEEPAGISKTFMSHNPSVIDTGCDWYRWFQPRASNGEIRISGDGVIFAAPVLIVHNIEEHGYLPPLQFLKALEAAAC